MNEEDEHPELNTDHPKNGKFESFYRSNYAAVSRYVARRLPPDSHDSVVASTFVIAWRKFDVVANPSLPWLYRIAQYEVAHERRRVHRQPESVALGDLQLIDTHPLEDVMDVSMAFSQLSENDAELLRLIHWERLSRSEVAETLGCSINTVNVRYHRAIDRLSATMHRLSSAGGERGESGTAEDSQ